MKKSLFVFITLCASLSCWAQSKSYVDERQELSAIVWKLAEAEEYGRPLYEPYDKAIKSYFSAYKKHPVMDLIHAMRDAPDSVDVVSYNSVPYSAELLLIEQGGVRLNPALDLKTFIQKFDNRWTIENLKQYAELLDDFYRQSKFARFFQNNTDLYARYEAGVDQILSEKIHPEWFVGFYGKPFPEMLVCVSPANGMNNYSKGTDFCTYLGQSGNGMVLGMTQDPALVSQSKVTLGVLLHELSHDFSNSVFAPYEADFRAIGEPIYAQLPRMLTAVGYGSPEIVAGEFLNELFTMMYMRDIFQDDLYLSIRSCNYHGFIWTDQALPVMEKFYKNRDQYPTIREFMPCLVEFMNSVAEHIVAIKTAYNETPHVVSVSPKLDSEVSSDLKEVWVRFSLPMDTGLTATKEPSTKGVASIHKKQSKDDEVTEYWADDYTLVYKVGVPLKSGKRYGIVIPARGTSKANGITMADDYEIRFNVK